MKKLLMLCAEFPPVNTTGNYRSAGFAKYLYENGIEPIVLTCIVESGVNTFGKAIDESLLDDLPKKLKIHRFPVRPFAKIWNTKVGNALRIWWNTTDKIDRRWYSPNVKAAVKHIIEVERPGAIYVSLPPFSSTRTAISISKQYNLPLIVDMRDAWSLWVTSPFSTRLHYWIVKRLERKLFTQASKIITVTPELANDFLIQHPSIDPEKIEVVFNGIDGKLNASDMSTPEKDKPSGDYFKVGYVGSFYYNPDAENLQFIKWWKRSGLKKLYYWPRKEQWIYRSPYYFLMAVQAYHKQFPLGRKIQFHFVGNEPHWLKEMINKCELINYYVAHGFQDKDKVLALQNGWDAILATSEKIVNRDHFCLPSKIFDAVESRKRILAFVTSGTQKRFLADYPQAVFFAPDEVLQNRIKLEEIIRQNCDIESKPLDKFYSREHQSQRFYYLLNENIKYIFV